MYEIHFQQSIAVIIYVNIYNVQYIIQQYLYFKMKLKKKSLSKKFIYIIYKIIFIKERNIIIFIKE